MNPPVFTLIGIEILNDCSKNLRKVLQPDVVYFFNNNYAQSASGEIVRKSPGIPGDFFFTNDCRGENLAINISCVVGKNGDGKSSIVELMIRILNNFAYLSGFLSDHDTLRFIMGLHARLWYAMDQKICCISCEGDKVYLTVDKEIIFGCTMHKKMHNSEKKKELQLHRDFLFYTLVSNFSLYAYNSEDFKSESGENDEEDAWIAALFHKNDGYQTPIVLIPQRDKGIININKEHSLSLQRLSELFFDCGSGKYAISPTEHVEGFAFNLDRESKLLNRTLSEYFQGKGSRSIIHFNGSLKRDKLSLNLSTDIVFKRNREFWEAFDNDIFNTSLWHKSVGCVNIWQSDDMTDLDRYFQLMVNKVRPRSVAAGVLPKIREAQKRLQGMTFLQLQRIVLVYEVWKKWIAMKPYQVSWCTVAPKGSAPWQYAINYLIYKTIHVFETYPDYFSNELHVYETPQLFFNNDARKRALDKMFEYLVEDINKAHSHITLKLRQTLYYLENFKTQSYYDVIDTHSESYKSQITQLGFSSYVDCEDYYNKIARGKQDFAAQLPPPIFKGEFLFSRQGQSSLYSISRMSSGERQLLNSASAIVYHLKNLLRSRESGLKIVYHNVNVILEEVELYFHPEYQRRFVHYLLSQIWQIRPSTPLSINLLFVTHSPFILSDIPKCNVLFLRDGRPDYSMQEDTFGANVHTLLRNGFFLDTVPIGEFAKTKINEMFALLNESRTLTQEELYLLEREIYLVSEPLLRSQLLKLYSQRIPYQNHALEQLVNQLGQRLHELECRNALLEQKMAQLGQPLDRSEDKNDTN